MPEFVSRDRKRRSPRWLLRLFVATFVLDALVVLYVGQPYYLARPFVDHRLPFDLRASWFGELVDERLFRDRSGDLSSFGFRSDSASTRDLWRDRLEGEVDYLRAGWSDGEGDTVAHIKALVMLFSRNGGPGCGAYRDLLHNIQRLPRGEGCCSDHSEVLIALASLAGIAVRELGHRIHSFDEFYAPELSKWVFVDPFFALMARDAAGGEPLSVMEIRDRLIRGEPVHWDFFGGEAHEFASRDPGGHPYYDDATDFLDLTLVLGNDVFAQDEFKARLAFLPRTAQQLAGLAVGALPGYAVLEDEHAHRPARYRKLRRSSMVFVLVSLVGLAAHPLSVLARYLRPR